MQGVAHPPGVASETHIIAQGDSLHQLSQQLQIPRPVLSSWWTRYRDGD